MKKHTPKKTAAKKPLPLQRPAKKKPTTKKPVAQPRGGDGGPIDPPA